MELYEKSEYVFAMGSPSCRNTFMLFLFMHVKVKLVLKSDKKSVCVAARHCMLTYDRMCVFVGECVCVLVWLGMNLDLERRDSRRAMKHML